MKIHSSLKLNSIHPLRFGRVNISVSRILFASIGSLLFMQARGQADKRLALADQYFASGEYLTAASLYGQFLKPVIKPKGSSDFPLISKRSPGSKTGSYASKTDIVFKQAESYRLANYWNEAAALYQECFEKDASKYAPALYWFAVCQRSLGNYEAAEESIDRFLAGYGKNSSYQQAAEKEKQTLRFIKNQLMRPDTVLYHVQKINAPFDTARGVFAPVSLRGNQFLLTSTQADSVALPGENPYHNRLFQSTLVDGSLENLQPVSIEGIDASLNQGTPGVSADGNHLYFTQWKRENGQVVAAIYYSSKTANGWSRPVLLPLVNQPGRNSKQPFCSADGNYLFFASDRSGGKGGFDIWYAPLKADGTTEKPVNAGAVINSAANEQAPFYHSANSILVFASDRLPGMGGYDLFSSKGSVAEWKTPENMGYPVNSSRDDVYFFAHEKGTVLTDAIISSDRGSECCLATYAVTKAPKKKLITGMILDCGNNEPLAGAQVVLKDATGRTFELTTAADGKYSFELSDDASQHQVTVTKEKYNEKTADVPVDRISENNWQTDTVHNEALCVEKKLVIKVENVVTVYFDFDKSTLTDRAVAQLDSIYNILTEDTTATIQVSGYTDGRGSAEYNKKLSDRRAKSCADYLVQKGIDPARISFESFGACCPVEMELLNGRDNPDGRSKNRRALINIDRQE